MSAQSKLTECKTAMLLHCPFFASLLLDMMRIEMGKFPNIFPKGNETMATNGRTIWIDEDFMESLKLPEAVFVLCHEVGHAMFMHMSRGKRYADTGFEGRKFSKLLWNIAGDYVINHLLVESGIGKMPKVGLLDENIAKGNDLVDDVYRKLLQEALDKEASGGGDGELGEGMGETIDVHILEESHEGEAEWKRAVASAADAAKAQGKLPAGMARFVEEMLNPKVAWEEYLRTKFMRKIGREAKDWNRLHRRRYVTQGVIMPAHKGYGCGTVVFCMDTSGSMSDGEIAQGAGECDKILTDCHPERVILIGCDAQVDSVHDLGPGDSLLAQAGKLELGGGGGTSFVPPFKWLEDEGIRPDCLVYFTDMGGSFPDWDPGYPVIWCATTDYPLPDDAPGELIKVDLT